MAVAPGLLNCKNLKRIYGIVGLVPVVDGRYLPLENRIGAPPTIAQPLTKSTSTAAPSETATNGKQP